MAAIDAPVTIKRNANRRLCSPGAASYVSLGNRADMVQDEQDVVMYDAKTGEDITRPVFKQVILERARHG